jgi:hypothetical protein
VVGGLAQAGAQEGVVLQGGKRRRGCCGVGACIHLNIFAGPQGLVQRKASRRFKLVRERCIVHKIKRFAEAFKALRPAPGGAKMPCKRSQTDGQYTMAGRVLSQARKKRLSPIKISRAVDCMVLMVVSARTNEDRLTKVHHLK